MQKHLGFCMWKNTYSTFLFQHPPTSIGIKRVSNRQVLLIKSTRLTEHIYKAEVLSVCWSAAFDCLLTQCKDVRNDIRQVTVAAVINPFLNNLKLMIWQWERLFTSGNIQVSCQSSQECTSQKIPPKVKLCIAQRPCKKKQKKSTSYISDSTEFS